MFGTLLSTVYHQHVKSTMSALIPENLTFSEVGHLPIVKHFAQKLHLVETFDTTSISVYGDYEHSDTPFKITYGHSKDKRWDLKQFLISMLCVDRNIPILGDPKNVLRRFTVRLKPRSHFTISPTVR